MEDLYDLAAAYGGSPLLFAFMILIQDVPDKHLLAVGVGFLASRVESGELSLKEALSEAEAHVLAFNETGGGSEHDFLRFLTSQYSPEEVL
ncbi:MAG: hypothetical protein D6698_16500 [Gammaproteobacteria bacterium]|nr:MAG: hypothetical protein D6698_16500 [Gammaproteobacteria bacterium]